MIVRQIEIEGYGNGRREWFEVRQADVSYDHPFKAPFEHALNIDFVNEVQGPAARISVELGPDSARCLAEAILTVLAQAEAGGYLERSPGSMAH